MRHADSRARRKAIARDIKAGMVTEQAAERYGVSVVTVRVACKENGVPPPRRHQARLDAFAILKRLLLGEGLSDIARDMGTSRQRVHRIKLDAIASGFVELKRTKGKRKKGAAP